MAGKVKKFGPRLTVSLTGQDYDALLALAEKDDVSVSWVMRRAIDEYLDNHRHEAEPVLPLRLPQKGERSSLELMTSND
nr:ribbon-helix-helix domain-containing protein [Halomonas elongata]